MSLTTSDSGGQPTSTSQTATSPSGIEELPGKMSLLVVGDGAPLVLLPGLSRDSRQLTPRIAVRRGSAYRGLRASRVDPSTSCTVRANCLRR